MYLKGYFIYLIIMDNNNNKLEEYDARTTMPKGFMRWSKEYKLEYEEVCNGVVKFVYKPRDLEAECRYNEGARRCVNAGLSRD